MHLELSFVSITYLTLNVIFFCLSISNSGLSRKSLVQNISLKNEWIARNTKIHGKHKFLGVLGKLNIWKCVSTENLGKTFAENLWNKVKHVFLWYVLQLVFLRFLAQLSIFFFWVTGLVIAISCKLFRDFFEIFYFPKTLTLKSFNNSTGNLYVHFFVIII